MFNKFVEALKTFFSAKPVRLQFEEMLLQEAVQKIKDQDAAREKVSAAVEAKATVADVAVKVEAVMAVAETKSKTTKKAPAKKASTKPATKKTTKKPNIKIAK